MKTYFLLFFLLLSHTEAKSIPHPPPAPSPRHFPLDLWPKDSLLPRPCPPLPPDHFWLVHTWPKGFYSNSSVHCPQPNNLPLELTIHGWWPVDRKDSTLNNNRQVGPINYLFTGEAGEELYTEMKNNWPNLTSPIEYRYGHIAFWEKEWARHGICSCFEPRLYFETALALKRTINVSQALRANGIKPGIEYPRRRFVKALRRKIPRLSFAMRCGDKNGAKILIEIRVCTNETHAISCSQRLKDNCGSCYIKLVSEIEPF